MITAALLGLTATQIVVPILAVLVVVVLVFAFSLQEIYMYFLLEANPEGIAQWILPIVLLVLVVGIFILNYFRSKKSQETMKDMVDSLKVGDNVKTYSGLYGKIIEIVETTDGKVAILETGSEKNKGIFSIDINAIYGIDEKKPVVYDAEGNIVDPEGEAKEGEASAEEKPAEQQPKEEKKKGRKKREAAAEPVVAAEPVETAKEAEPEVEKEPEAAETPVAEEKPKAKKKSKKQ